jgi:hypothetical protein
MHKASNWCWPVLVWLLLGLLGGVLEARPPQYDKAYFDQIKQERAERIERVRETIDLEAIPQWRTRVRSTDDHVIVSRQTSVVWFNRRTGAIDRVKVLGIDMEDACELASLQLVDGEGVVYRQAWCADGQLSVIDEKFNLYLDGQFTPWSADGTSSGVTCRVRYKLYKTSGLITVRMEVVESDGQRVFSQATFVNTLGNGAGQLDAFHANFYQDRFDSMYRPHPLETVEGQGDQVLYTEKLPSALWTDGRIGLEVMPLFDTWDQMVSDGTGKGDKYVTAKVEAGRRYINMCFLSVSAPQSVGVGQRMDFSLALLPFRRFDGRVRISHGGLAPLFSYDAQLPLTEENEIYFERLAADGVEYLHGAGMESRIFIFPNQEQWFANFDRFIEVAHKYGLKVYWTLSWERFEAAPLIEAGYFTEEEVVGMLRATTGRDLNPWQDNINITTESARFREAILDSIVMGLRDFSCDGVYFDLGTIFAATEDWPGQIEGNVQLMEDIKLLLRSFGPEKSVTYHAGFEVSPLEGMADSILPGEPIAGARFATLPDALYRSVYNSHLLGTGVPLYDNESYDLTKTDIFKQAYRNGLSYSQSRLVADQQYRSPRWLEPAAADNARKFFSPFAVFDTSSATFHSFNDADFRRFAAVHYSGDTETPGGRAYVNVYSRAGECLLTATNDPGRTGRADVELNLRELGVIAEQVIVLDVVHGEGATIKKVTNGRITLDNIQFAQGPCAYVVSAVGDEMKVVWRDVEIDDYHFEDLYSQGRGTAGEGCRISATIMDRGEYDRSGFWLYTGEHGRPTLNNFSAISVEHWDASAKLAYVVFRTSPAEAGAAAGPMQGEGSLGFVPIE